MGQHFPESTLKNQQSAIHYSSHVDEYIGKESAYGAIIGPYSSNPFQIPLTISPLLSVPKKETSERRTVMDLSFPEGSSVNDGIPRDTYLGDPFNLHYPATDNLIHLMNKHGQECLLYKVDIKRCYRWIPVDPTISIFSAYLGRISFTLTKNPFRGAHWGHGSSAHYKCFDAYL